MEGTSGELKKQSKAKGKKVVNLSKEVNKPVTEKETNEFLKLLKHNKYNIVEQLKKTLVRISLLSLILSSETH